MWFYKIVCVLMLVILKVKVSANYLVSHESTQWGKANCSLAEPQLAYKNESFHVNESLGVQINYSDVWIGYRLSKIPFLFLGCGVLDNITAYLITSIGYCFNLCRSGPFGIKMFGDDDILSNSSMKECQCTSRRAIAQSQQCNGAGNNLCNNNANCAAIFTSVNASNANKTWSNVDNTPGDCLLYYYPYFVWRQCQQADPIKVMCSNSQNEDLSATSKIVDPSTVIWTAGNALCLSNNKYPASVGSINNSGFGYPEQQYFWTGIIRSVAIINRSTVFDKVSRYPVQQFAFIQSGSRVLQFTINGSKRALCVSEELETTSTVTTNQVPKSGVSTTTFSTHEDFTPETAITDGFTRDSSTPQVSTSEDSIPRVSKLSTSHEQRKPVETNPENPEKFPIVGVGIGVAVGTMFAVGAVVVIALLRGRGIMPCKRRAENDETVNGKPVFEEDMSYGKKIDENVVKHNHINLEKRMQSVKDNADHYNTACEPNDDNAEDDNYNSIQDTEEPYERVKDDNCDYDYTTNALASGPCTSTPVNVYNKLKIERPSEYDHVGRRGHNLAHVSGSDYDTTSVALTGGKEDTSDYNHIPHSANVPCTRGNEAKGTKPGDYDVINGMKFKVVPSDTPGYAHVKM